MIPLLANAGTPLIWLTGLHLLVGNIAIGLGEGFLLRRCFRIPAKGFWGMVAANFASMLCGIAMLAGVVASRSERVSPSGAGAWIAAAAATYFAVTVLVEWPFVAWAMEPGRRDWRRALLASLLVNAASYAVLVLLYAKLSSVDLLTKTTGADPAQVAGTTRAHIYYVGADQRSIWRVALDGTARERLADAAASKGRMRIVADPDAGVVRAADEAGVAVKAPGRMKARVNTAGLYRAVDLGDGPWEASAEFWAEAGLRASSTRTGEQLHFALATPFVRWRASDATVLPGGVVVYALGPHIVSLDLATHRLAVLAEGSCPVVALADR